MIELAHKFNLYGERCQYYLNSREDLRLFDNDSFDFIMSMRVLQHMQPEYSERYVREFIRVLAPGGVLVFQLPTERVAPSSRVAADVTASTQRLPDSAFRARIEVTEPPLVARAGGQLRLSVRLTNTGDVTWPAGCASDGTYQINLGNHWLDASGNCLLIDDSRANLPRDLPPTTEAMLPLVVNVPLQPGEYMLELDMVQELVAWFKDRGSPALRLPLTVAPSAPNNHQARIAGVAGRLHVGQNKVSRLKHFGSRKVRLPLPGTSGHVADEQPAPDSSELLIPRMEMYAVPAKAVAAWVNGAGAELIGTQESVAGGSEWPSLMYCSRKAL
jgi:hypothetical protein